MLRLRFDTPDARRLGLEGHVCELQLTTPAFAARAKVRGACGSERPLQAVGFDKGVRAPK